MATTGIADAAPAIQTLVSALMTQTLIQESVSLQVPGVWDRSGEVGPGMDTLDMILQDELAIQTVDETGAAMTAQSIVLNSQGLVLDQHKSVPFAITERASLQSKVDMLRKSLENGVRSLAADIDDFVFAEGVANTGTTETVAGADGLADIRGAKKQFEDDNVPRMGRSIIASPEWVNNKLLASNNIIRANEYGSDRPIRTGFVAEVYGFSIYESSSSSLPDDGFLALGMEAVAFARQRAMEFQEQLQVLNQKRDYTLTHLYGAQTTAATNPRIYVYNPA